MSNYKRYKPGERRKAKGDEMTWAELAKTLGIHVNALASMRKRKDAPVLCQVDIWQDYIESIEATDGDVSEEKKKADLEYRRKQIEKLDAELASIHHSTISKSEHERILSAHGVLLHQLVRLALEREFPTRSEGMSLDEKMTLGRELADNICERITEKTGAEMRCDA